MLQTLPLLALEYRSALNRPIVPAREAHFLVGGAEKSSNENVNNFYLPFPK
jgi:hypothetical protein